MNKYPKYISSLLAIVLVMISCKKKKKVPVQTHFYAPNSFSPNGDGMNDTFKVIPIFGIVVKEFHMSIYDPSLQLMFETEDVFEGWNGKTQGVDAPQGFYEYQLIYWASQPLDSTTIDTVYTQYHTSSNVNLFRE